MSQAEAELVEELLDGSHRALARTITKVENRAPGYRDLVSALHAHTGDAEIVGITGSPGAGKSTLVDKLAKRYRDQGFTVGVIAVDPSSPYTGGAVLGDRIRMASNVGDMEVFFRSMSARGRLGGLSTATSDAVTALDAFGKDKIIIETVGAGQNEVDIVKTADSVVVLVQPASGDDVQMLKAGILEIGDVFVVNKADMDGTARTVAELEEMIHLRSGSTKPLDTGHHGPTTHDTSGNGETTAVAGDAGSDGDSDPVSDEDEGEDEPAWTPEVIETVATSGDGIGDLVDQLDAHRDFLDRSGRLRERARTRYAEKIRTLIQSDVSDLVARELDARGGVDTLAEAVLDRETDPYTVADEVVSPIEDCVDSTD